MQNNILVYVIYEPNELLKKWNINLYKEFKDIFTKMICVINGKLNDESMDILNNHFSEIIIRENKGYDVTAYFETVSKLITNYDDIDEITLCNNSIIGPMNSLKKMFNTMRNKECDFWGITSNGNKNTASYHIQSYFISLKKEVLYSEHLKEYIKAFPVIINQNDAISKVETQFTNHFINKGFKADTYIHRSDNCPVDIVFADPVLSLIQGNPFIKVKSFIQSTKQIFRDLTNNSELFTYIEKNTDFNINSLYLELIKDYSYDDLDIILNNNLFINEEINDEENQDIINTCTIVCYDYITSNHITMIKENYYFPINTIFKEISTFQDIINILKDYHDFDIYTVLNLTNYAFTKERINYKILKNKYKLFINSENYYKRIINKLLNSNIVSTYIPADFIGGVTYSYKSKPINTAYNLIKNNKKNILESKTIDVFSMASSFIIKKQVRDEIIKYDTSNVNGYESFIVGSQLIRYITHYMNFLTKKILNTEYINSYIGNSSYIIKNKSFKDLLKEKFKRI